MQKQKTSQGLTVSGKSSSLKTPCALGLRACLRGFLLVLACALAVPTLAERDTFFARATSVPDGDTLWVQPLAGGSARKLRLLGIDAPEICQDGGVAARDALRTLVTDQRLLVVTNFQDDYGRDLVRVYVQGQDIGVALVSQGHAWSSRWRKSLGPYAVQESAARQAGLGLFANPQAELPQDFRKRFGSCYVADADGVLHLR